MHRLQAATLHMYRKLLYSRLKILERRSLLMRKPPLDLIKRALEEDGAEYDITTLSTVPEEHLAHASLIARQDGVVAGLSVAAATFQLLDERIVINLLVQDGDTVHSDQVLAHLEGPARSLLSGERPSHRSRLSWWSTRCTTCGIPRSCTTFTSRTRTARASSSLPTSIRSSRTWTRCSWTG